MSEKRKYSYKGYILNNYKKVLCDNFSTETIAVSRRDAINNIKSQAKTYCNLMQTARIYIDEEKVREV